MLTSARCFDRSQAGGLVGLRVLQLNQTPRTESKHFVRVTHQHLYNSGLFVMYCDCLSLYKKQSILQISTNPMRRIPLAPIKAPQLLAEVIVCFVFLGAPRLNRDFLLFSEKYITPLKNTEKEAILYESRL